MLNGSAIRTYIEVDALLQVEISASLLALAEAPGAASAPRLARMLARTLEPSWLAHVSLQEHVVVPILAAYRGDRLGGLMCCSDTGHASLSQQHAEIGRHLARAGANASMSMAELDGLLRAIYARRLDHLAHAGRLIEHLPGEFSAADCALWRMWLSLRRGTQFPLDLIWRRAPSARVAEPLH